MKTFKKIREATKGDVVFDKKINRIPVVITKSKNDFIVKIDGDELDKYKSQKEAEKMAKEFIKQYKG